MVESVKSLFDGLKSLDDFAKSTTNNVRIYTQEIEKRLENPAFVSVLLQPCYVNDSVVNETEIDLAKTNRTELSTNMYGMFDFNGASYNLSNYFYLTKENASASVLDFLFKVSSIYYGQGNQTLKPSLLEKSYAFFLERLLDFYGKTINDKNHSLREALNESVMKQALLNASSEMRKHALEKCPDMFAFLPEHVINAYGSLRFAPHRRNGDFTELKECFEIAKTHLNGKDITPVEKMLFLQTISRTIFPGQDFSAVLTEALSNSPKAEFARGIAEQFSAIYSSDKRARVYVNKFDLTSLLAEYDKPEELLALCPALFDFLPTEIFANEQYLPYMEMVKNNLPQEFINQKVARELKNLKIESLKEELKKTNEELLSLKVKYNDITKKIDDLENGEGK